MLGNVPGAIPVGRPHKGMSDFWIFNTFLTKLHFSSTNSGISSTNGGISPTNDCIIMGCAHLFSIIFDEWPLFIDEWPLFIDTKLPFV